MYYFSNVRPSIFHYYKKLLTLKCFHLFLINPYYETSILILSASYWTFNIFNSFIFEAMNRKLFDGITTSIMLSQGTVNVLIGSEDM